jgi:hypothetical protein
MNPTSSLKLSELIGLASNLRFMEGGQKFFRDTVNSNPNYSEEKLGIIGYCKTQGYLPMTLKDFSPYEKDWIYATLLESSVKKGIVRLKPYESKSIEEVRAEFGNTLSAILESQDTNIHVVKVPTGIGKTECCLSLERVLLSFPNHALKGEVSARMKVGYSCTPGTDGLPDIVKTTLADYYSVGAIEEGNKYLQDLAKEDPLVDDYLRQCEHCYASENTVLTTHQKGLFINWQHKTLIFDEDILNSLLPMSKVIVNDLLRLNEKVTNDVDKNTLKEIIDDIISGQMSLPKRVSEVRFSDNDAIKKSVLDEASKYESNPLHFLDAEWCVVDPRDAATVHYVGNHPLPKDKKIIILSATANETLYKALFGDRLQFHDVGDVSITGLIEQDGMYSFSRMSFPKHVEYAQERVGALPVITFDKYKQYFPNAVEEAHFGKTTGFDGLKGQDIAVVGTPHVNPITLVLYSKILNMEVNNTDLRNIRQQVVEHNGFRFWMNTYDNIDLRNLQFHFIESELRQAIGRARVNTEPAHVLLLSNYPLPEAAINLEEVAVRREILESKRGYPRAVQRTLAVAHV